MKVIVFILKLVRGILRGLDMIFGMLVSLTSGLLDLLNEGIEFLIGKCER